MRTRPCQPPPHPAPLPGLGRLVIPVLVLTLLVLVPPPRPATAQAQASTGVIRGVVRDALGAPLPEAEVVITHRETGLRTSVLTTPSATFVRPLLPVGTYDVVVRGAGQLGEETAPGLVLRVGETLDLSFSFRPVDLEGITVEGEREHLVHPEDVTSSTRLSEEVVDGLPNNGRNYLDFALLTPGVAPRRSCPTFTSRQKTWSCRAPGRSRRRSSGNCRAGWLPASRTSMLAATTSSVSSTAMMRSSGRPSGSGPTRRGAGSGR